jgi:hypothetical protein
LCFLRAALHLSLNFFENSSSIIYMTSSYLLNFDANMIVLAIKLLFFSISNKTSLWKWKTSHCESEKRWWENNNKKKIDYKELKWISLKKALDENWSYVQYVQYVQWILLMYLATFHDFMQLYAISCDVLSSFIVRCKARLFAIRRKESLLLRMINHVY